MKSMVLIGPPGTGKTSAGTTLSKDWFGSGAKPEEVAYLGFTRAAARAVAEKIMDGDLNEDAMREGFPLFRTLHSLAYRGLRKANPDAKVMTPSHMKQFSKQTGFEGAYAIQDWEDLAEVYQGLAAGGRTEWDSALSAYNLSRISAGSKEDLDRVRTVPSRKANLLIGLLDEKVYRVFVQKYEAWKQKEGLVDFTDMLEYALLQMPALEQTRFVVVDECQDLAKILHRIVDRLFPAAEQIWWIGDPDQAIYSFAAADASLFYDRLRAADHVVTLRQTHRFGQEVVEFSKKVIRRVRDRLETEVIGFPGREHQIRKAGQFKPFAGEGFILHRHVRGCQNIAQAYIDAGLPFRNERGRDPLGSVGRMKSFEALEALAEGQQVAIGSAARLVEELMPSSVVSPDGTRTRLVVHGGKKKVSAGGGGYLRLHELVRDGILTYEGSQVIHHRQYGLFKHSSDLEYYARVRRNGYDLDSKGPTIVTIHGVKGRQAPHVTVFSEMGKKCWSDADTEHRLAYVASTRTKGSLEICYDRQVDWAESNYEYPV